MSLFSQYIGIDYSGAKAPNESLSGLRIYCVSDSSDPNEVLPPPSPRKYWTRQGVAEWIVERLRRDKPTIIGIDHGFSFPIKYFERHRLLHDWNMFLEDFRDHWPTDEENVYVQFVRDGLCGNGKARQGDRRWLRLTEHRTGAAKSVFFFDAQGSVAKSTHAGLPWLWFIKKQLGEAVHFWPFDGWTPRPDTHVIAEVYPRLWNRRYPAGNRTNDQQDAYAVCRWLKEADLTLYFDPLLEAKDRPIAEIEGWILGVL